MVVRGLGSADEKLAWTGSIGLGVGGDLCFDVAGLDGATFPALEPVSVESERSDLFADTVDKTRPMPLFRQPQLFSSLGLGCCGAAGVGPVHGQGKRKLAAFDTKDLQHEVVAPAGHSSAHDDAFLAVDLLEKPDREAFQPGHIVGRDPIPQPTLVLAEGHIQAPVQGIFDRPMATHGLSELLDVQG